MSAAVEQSRRKANMVAQGDGNILPLRLTEGPLQVKKKGQGSRQELKTLLDFC